MKLPWWISNYRDMICGRTFAYLCNGMEQLNLLLKKVSKEFKIHMRCKLAVSLWISWVVKSSKRMDMNKWINLQYRGIFGIVADLHLRDDKSHQPGRFVNERKPEKLNCCNWNLGNQNCTITRRLKKELCQNNLHSIFPKEKTSWTYPLPSCSFSLTIHTKIYLHTTKLKCL